MLSPVLSQAGFDVYAQKGVVIDSNLFRLPSDANTASVLGVNQRSDMVDTTAVGFDIEGESSGQSVSLQGELDRGRFQRFDFLDYDGGKANGLWNLSLGEYVTGQAGYSYDLSLTSFSDLQSAIRDLITRKTVLASIVLMPQRELQGYIGYNVLTSDHSSPLRNQLDYRNAHWVARIQRVLTENDNTGIEFDTTDGKYPNLEVSDINLIDNAYRQTGIGPVASWNPSGQSIFQFKTAYTRRSYENVSLLNFSGITGRLTYNWLSTGKSGVTFELWRDLSSADDGIERYVVSNGIRVSPSWSITSALQLQVNASYEYLDYKGELVSGSSSRKDDVANGGLYLLYKYGYFSAQMYYDIESRGSNRAFSAYKDQQIGINIRIEGHYQDAHGAE